MGDDHRNYLAASASNASQSYDRAILSLSAGGLGASVVFINALFDLKTISSFTKLFWVWGLWILAITLTVLSLYLSRLAMDKAIDQYDANPNHTDTPGGFYTNAIKWLIPASGISFLSGVILFLHFTIINLG